MSEQVYQTAILGATFYGIAAALSEPGTIIIERSGSIGNDFVASLNEKPPRMLDIKSPLGLDFKQNLEARGLTDGSGAVYSGPALYVVSDYLKKANTELLLLTEVVEIKKAKDYYILTVYNNEGFSRINARTILDTTATGVLHDCGGRVSRSKKLGVLVKTGMSPTAHDPSGSSKCEMLHNPISGLSTLHIPLNGEDGWIEARKKLHSFWKAEGLEQSGARIAFVATEFAYNIAETMKKIMDEWFWIPSCSFGNLLDAFDQGTLFHFSKRDLNAIREVEPECCCVKG